MTLSRGEVRVFGIIPAAGMSRRMGRAKQTLPFGGTTVTGTVARTLLGADLAGVVVVTRTELADALDLPTDRRVTVAINDAADSEMIDSIRIGLELLTKSYSEPWASARAVSRREGTLTRPDAGVLVVPGDMPALSVESCRACVAAYIADPTRIVIAAYKGTRGHPIVFPLSLRSTVDRVSDGLRSLARMYPDQVRLVETDEPACPRDVDTPEEYERL